MKSETLGASTSAPEVTNISRHGFWLLVDDEELFVPFSEFPWFRSAPVSAVLNVQSPRPDQLHWPEIDVDLTVDSIRHPGKYPLVSSR